MSSLAGDAELERFPDRPVEPPQLVAIERAGRPLGMELRVPERLVDVDVPEPGERPLVEQRRLQRGAPPLQPLAQALRREGRDERLVADPGVEELLELARLEQQPRPEPLDAWVR